MDSCPNCNSPVSADQRFCVYCGYSLGAAAAAARVARPPVTELPAPRAAAGDLGLRELFYALALALAQEGRHAEALAAAERARTAPGTEPADADVAIAAALAANGAGRFDESIRLSLEAALLDEAPRRGRIVAYLQDALSTALAASVGRWLVEQWWPAYRARCSGPEEILPAQLLAARAQLCLADHDKAIEAFRAAAALDAGATSAELTEQLAPGRLPPSLASGSPEAALVVGRLWQAVGDPARGLAAIQPAIADLPEASDAEAPLYELQAELLILLERAEEAAASFHNAGNRCLWNGETDKAQRLLERAIALDPANAEAHWALADALRIASAADGVDDETRAERIRQARAVWDAGTAQSAPSESSNWALVVAAQIAVRSADLAKPPRRPEGLWEAVLLTERALLLDPSDALRLVNLSEFHRGLLNQQTALACSRAAFEIVPDGVEVLSEFAVVLTNTGHWDEAHAVLEKFEPAQRDAWWSNVAALVCLYRGLTDDALARADEALAKAPDNVSYLNTRAMVLRVQGRLAEARSMSTQLADRLSPDELDNLNFYGWAALESGRLKEALAAFELDLSRASTLSDIGFGKRSVAFALLALGDVEGARASYMEGMQMPMDAETRWLSNHCIDEFEKDAEQWDGRERVAPLLAEFRRLRDALPPLESATPRAELETALALAPPDEPRWQAVAALAGLARLDVQEQLLEAAGDRYARMLRDWPELVPEAQLGIDAVVVGQYGAMSVRDYWNLRDHATPARDWQRPLLERYLDLAFGLIADAGDTCDTALAVTPIVIEMDASLVPPGDSEQWPILQTYLPEFRTRIKDELGVEIPGTRLRGFDEGMLDAGQYVVGINEAPSYSAIIPPGAAYAVADAETLQALAVTPVSTEFDLQQLRAAAWIAPADAATVRDAGVDVVEDPMRYLVRQLEACVRAELAEFVGIDQVAQLLVDWKKTARHDAAIDRWLADDDALMRLTRLLRRLVFERVPIVDGASIVDAVVAMGDHGLRSDAATLRAVRQRLCGALVAAIPDEQRVRLPSEFEASLQASLIEQGNGSAMVFSNEAFQALTAAVGKLLPVPGTARALLVESAVLRPHLRDIFAFAFPGLAVFALEELPPASAAPASRVAA